MIAADAALAASASFAVNSGDNRLGDAASALCPNNNPAGRQQANANKLTNPPAGCFLTCAVWSGQIGAWKSAGSHLAKLFNLFDLIPYEKHMHFTFARRRGPPLWLRQTNKNQHRGD